VSSLLEDRQIPSEEWGHSARPDGSLIKTPNGYSAEIAVPVDWLDSKQGAPWQEFRIDIAVNDFDHADHGAQTWWKPDWRSRATYVGSGTFARNE
jgi:hypothetical protein